MAEIAHGVAEELTDQTHTGDTNWSTAATAASGNFVAGGKYLILCIAQYGGTSSALHVGARLAYGATPTVFLGSEIRVETAGAAGVARNQYHYFTVFDQPGGGAEDIVFQIKTFDVDETVHADTIEIIWIRLDADLTENVDWVYNEDDDSGAPPELPVAWGTTYASKTWTPGNNNDDWLVLANASYIANSATYQIEFRINRDSATEVAPLMSCEPEDADEDHTHTLGRVFTLSNASHTLAVEGLEESASANAEHHSSRIFALRLDAFQDHGFFWNEDEISVATGSTWEIGNVDLTPTAQHDFFILGQAVVDAAASMSFGHWMRIGGTDTPTGTNDYRDIRTYDNADESPGSDGFIRSLADSLQAIDMFARTTSGTKYFEDRSVCVVSMELAGAPPAGQPTQIRTQGIPTGSGYRARPGVWN